MRAPQRGYSLIELLVAVTIGLVGILAMYQTFSAWEGRQRTVIGGSDVQVTATVAQYMLDRDLKTAGMGFGAVATPTAGCTVIASNSALSTPSINFVLTPVEIGFGAASESDVLRVLHGNSAYLTAGQRFDGGTPTTKSTTVGRGGIQQGDIVVFADGTNCYMAEITDTSNTDGHTVGHAAGSYTSFYTNTVVTSTRSPVGGTGTTFSGGGTIYDLGPAPERTVWSRSEDKLVRYNSLAENNTTDQAVAEGLVDMQAEYGIDSNGNNHIDSTEWSNTAPADSLTWSRVLGVRVGLLLRSSQREKESVTIPPDGTALASWAWSGQSTSPLVMRNPDGSADQSATGEWSHYRYVVQESWVSFRNVLWGNAAP